MPLRLLLGAAGTGKTRACLEGMRAVLGEVGGEAPLILLVPEQASHLTERLALERLGPSPRYQVLSFRRLAWRVFQQAGGAARPSITDLGRKLVLRAILQRRRSHLGYFGDLADRPGLLEYLERTLRECRAYELGPAELLAAADGRGGDRAAGPVLPGKLRDLALIMTEFEGHLAGRYTDPDMTLTRLAERLPAAPIARGARIWVDGFAGFTPQEYRVLAVLLDIAEEVAVTLCLDARGTYESAGLFAPTLDTRESLLLLAGRAEQACQEEALGSGEAVPRRFAGARGIAHLERAFFAPGSDKLAAEAPDVTLCAAPDARAEVAACAREILWLCRDEGFRMRDIAVITRDPDTYHPLLAMAFAEHGIPCFVDQRRPVAYHALVELLRSAVEAVAGDWPFEALFRFLKTDLAPASREEVDRLENVALEFGLRGRARWTGRGWPGPDWLRALRDRAVAPLAAFHRRSAGRRPIRQTCGALFSLIEDLKVPGELASWAHQAEQAGDLEGASEHLQVYDAVLDLLDQLVEALGTEEMTPAEFLPLLEAGLAGLHLGLVPPSLDQVVVGSVERSRHPEIRGVFVLGASEGSFPRAGDEDLVLDDVEREALAARGVRLGPTSQERLLHEPFAMYLALTRAGERLYLSHAQTAAGGQAQPPSILWSRAQELLPGCRRLEAGAVEGDTAAIATVAQLAEWVASAPGHQSSHTAADLAALHDWLLAAPEREAIAAPVLAALRRGDGADPLPPDLVAALYGTELTVSASRLEAMAACPFKHFARHGLGLSRRPVFRVEPLEVGRLLHGALERLVRALLTEGGDLGQLDALERAARIGECVRAALAGAPGSPLEASGQARYLVVKLERALGAAAGALAEHSRRGRFRPAAVEVSFGPEDPAGGLSIAMSGGRRLEIRGRIDRLDIAPDGSGGSFVLVIDYKRTSRDLVPAELEHGLALQMALYLAVATRRGAAVVGLPAGSSPVRPAGMLYFPVQPSWEIVQEPPDPERSDQIALKAHKTRGLLGHEAAVAGLFDAGTGYSPIVPLRIGKDGHVVPGQSRVASESELAALLDAAVEHAGRLGEAILDGTWQAAPYRLGDTTPCRFCDYGAVCRFDPGAGDLHRELGR